MRILIAFLLILIALPCASQPNGVIGLFCDDTTYFCCSKNAIPFIETRIWIIPCGWFEGESAAEFEFRVDNLPSHGYPGGHVETEFPATSYSGDINTGVHLLFDPPISPEGAVIGIITLIAFDPTWVGEDRELSVMPSEKSGRRGFVSAEGQFYSMQGGEFVLNGWMYDCPCHVPVTNGKSWGCLKSLY